MKALREEVLHWKEQHALLQVDKERVEYDMEQVMAQNEESEREVHALKEALEALKSSGSDNLGDFVKS